jgi:hypothetical protein
VFFYTHFIVYEANRAIKGTLFGINPGHSDGISRFTTPIGALDVDFFHFSFIIRLIWD